MGKKPGGEKGMVLHYGPYLPMEGAAKIGPLRRDQASNSILFSYFFVPATTVAFLHILPH